MRFWGSHLMKRMLIGGRINFKLNRLEPTLLTSLIGMFFFSMIMYLGFRYSDGKWKVSESKKSDYLIWSRKYGKTIKKVIIIVSIIYGVAMVIQILSLT